MAIKKTSGTIRTSRRVAHFIRPSAQTRRRLLLGSSLTGGALMAFAAMVAQTQPAWAVETLTAACLHNATSPNDIYQCAGPASAPIELDPTHTFKANFGGDSSDPFVWTGSATEAVTINAGGNDTFDYGILFNAKSSITNTGGEGLLVTDVGDVVINVNGPSTVGGSDEASIVGTLNGIRVDGQAFSEGGVGDGIFGDSITLNNAGHVRGTGGTGNGAEITYVTKVTVNNTSHNSMIGGNNGDYIHGVGQVTYNNHGGLTAGLAANGVDIDTISNAAAGDAVTVDNRQQGVFAGSSNGVYVYGVSATGEGDDDVYVHNEAAYTAGSWVSGGLMAGVGGDGLHVDHVGGDLTVDNEFTQQGSINLNTLDPLVYTTASGGSGLLFGQLPNNDQFTNGIYGGLNGIVAWGINGAATIDNEDGQIVANVGSGLNFYTDGSFLVDNTGATYGAGLPVAGGTIWGGSNGITGNVIGTGGDVVVAEIDNGGRTAEGHGGIIFGEQAGIALSNIAGDALVFNEGGVVEGYYGEGVAISGLTESDHYSVVYNAGADAGLGYHEGHIIAGNTAVDLVSGFAGLWNSGGGVVVGDGSDSEPVINFVTLEGESDAGVGGVVANGGILTSQSNPNVDQTSAAPAKNTFPLGGNGALGSAPDYTIDTAQIVADASAIATYAMGDQSNGSIDTLNDYAKTAADLLFNSEGGAGILVNGEKFSLLSDTDIGGNVRELAPEGTIPESDGVVDNAIMFGRVHMNGDSSFLNESEHLVSVGNTVVNFGKWFTTNEDNEGDLSSGNIVTGENESGIANAGFIQTAFDSESDNLTTFETDTFYNGLGDEFFTDNNDNVGETPGFDGWLSLVDGGIGDKTTVAADFHGSYNTDLYHSYLAIDANFDGSGESGPAGTDELIVEGDVYGSTGVVVHKLNTTTSVNLDADHIIPTYEVARVTGDVENECESVWCATGDAFYIDPHSNGYVDVGGTGFVRDGMYMWGIQEVENPDPFYLVPTWGPDAIVQASVTTGIGAAGLDTAFVPEDNAYGNTVFGQTGGGGADLPAAEAVVAPPASPAGNQSILWGRIIGDWSGRDTSVTESNPALTFDTSSSQDTYALQAGLEFRPNADGDGVRLGLYGGYLSTDLAFDSYGASAKGSGGSLGGYASLIKGPWYIDGELKADFLGVTYSSPSITANTNAVNVVAIVNTGYHIDYGKSFLEPIASFTYTNTTLGDMTGGGATVSYSDGHSIRAGLGARVGTTVSTAGGTQTQLDLLGRIWDEFGGPNTVTLTDGNPADTTSFSDSIAGLSAEVVARATIYNADRTTSGFASVGGKFGSSATSITAKVGVRKVF